MQQRLFIETGLAPELAQASDELGIAALLDSTAESLSRFGGADSLVYSVQEWSETIRSSAMKSIRNYVQENLMRQRVFDSSGSRYCVVCHLEPCICSVGFRDGNGAA